MAAPPQQPINVTPGTEIYGTHRVPPAWQPNTPHSYRDWERDIQNWLTLTDLDEAQQAGAIYQRVGGMAKVLLREIPSNVLAHGNAHGSGTDILLRALRQRWGTEMQAKQLELHEAFESFSILPREDHDDALTRFDIIRTRAREEANLIVSSTSLARKLLVAFRVPEDQWALILAPTQGLLPTDEPQYMAFVEYLRRHLTLHFRRSNPMHPIAPDSLGTGKAPGVYVTGLEQQTAASGNPSSLWAPRRWDFGSTGVDSTYFSWQ